MTNGIPSASDVLRDVRDVTRADVALPSDDEAASAATAGAAAAASVDGQGTGSPETPRPPRSRAARLLALLRASRVARAPSGALYAHDGRRWTALRAHLTASYATTYNDVAPTAAIAQALGALGEVAAMPDDDAASIEPRATAAEHDDRPGIVLGPELHTTVLEALEALGADATIYHRDAQLVHVVPVDADLTERGAAWVAGTPQIRTLPLPELRVGLSRVARWFRFDRRARRHEPTGPSSHVVEAIHARGEWPTLRPLVGVIETPGFRPDGSIIDKEGYDAATGYLYRPSGPFPDIASDPTRADAVAALAALREVFADFPYAGVGAEVPIAALLTLIARPMIAGAAPVFLFDATTPGSGKSLQTDAVATIASGRRSSRMNWPTSEEEVEKCIGAFALRGAAAINFDNVRRPFGGGAIERVSTATDRVSLRVLGTSEARELRWRAIIMASGNNLQIEGETIRRCLSCRLEPNHERPEERKDFAHPNLLAWIGGQRPALVAAACTVIAAWVGAGRPQLVPSSWGSFEPWAATIPQAIAFAGGADVLGARVSRRDEGHDSEAIALRALFDAIERLDPGPGVTMRGLVAALFPERDPHGAPRPPDGFDDARDAVETLIRVRPGHAPSAKQVGDAMRRFRGKVLGGKKLHADEGRVAQWRVMPA